MNKLVFFVVAFMITFAGCGGAPSNQSGAPGETETAQVEAEMEPLSQADLVDLLVRNGVTFEWMEKSNLTPEQFKNLGAEPVSHSSVRLRKDKESTGVTLVEFKNATEAGNVENVNGFALHNWYFVGTLSQYWVDEIKYAVE